MGAPSDKVAQGTSGANAAQTVTLTCPEGTELFVTGYLVVIRAADCGADTLIEIRDENDTVLWRDYLGSAQKRGDKAGAIFTSPLTVGWGKNAKLYVGAAGAACITEASLTAFAR